jgi:hypothetical protein
MNDCSNSRKNDNKARDLKQFDQKVQDLDDKFCFINDLLWCSVRNLNVTMCEYIMQQFVYKTLLKDVLLLFDNGDDNDHDDDDDDVSTKAIYSRTSLYVIAKIFKTIDYAPLLKMIAVALLHPYTPLPDQLKEMERHDNEYIITPALNAIACNDFVVVDSETIVNDESNSNFSNAVMEESTTLIIESEYSSDDGDDDDSNISIVVTQNLYRAAMIHYLTGINSCKSFINAAMVFESILEAKSAIDHQVLKMLEVLPCVPKDDFDKTSKGSYDDDDDVVNSLTETETCMSSPFEDAIVTFLNSNIAKSWTENDSLSLDVGVSLTTCFISCLLKSYTEDGITAEHFDERATSSSLLKCLLQAKTIAAKECKRFQSQRDMSIVFPDLLFNEISSLYKSSTRADKVLTQAFQCNLRQCGYSCVNASPRLSLLESQSISFDDEVKDAQFSIRKAILFQLLNEKRDNLVSKISDVLKASDQVNDDLFTFDSICNAKEEILKLGLLQTKPTVGAEMNLKGKANFQFYPSLAISQRDEVDQELMAFTTGHVITAEKKKRRQIADKILLNSSSKIEMILVVDEEAVIVLKPHKSREYGTILCYTELQNIIAVAPDGKWLHIAMRNVEDVGVLIKKG